MNYWANGTVDSWMKEIDQLRDMLYLYANVPKNQVQVGSYLIQSNQFNQALFKNGIIYLFTNRDLERRTCRQAEIQLLKHYNHLA